MSTPTLLAGSELKRYDPVYYEDVPCEGGCGEEATCTAVEREDLSAGEE